MQKREMGKQIGYVKKGKESKEQENWKFASFPRTPKGQSTNVLLLISFGLKIQNVSSLYQL